MKSLEPSVNKEGCNQFMKSLEPSVNKEVCKQCMEPLNEDFYLSPYNLKYCNKDHYTLFTED